MKNSRVYAEDLDGKLNIITGKKESGKSHLSKMLVKTLVQHGACVIVFDLNNEYRGIGCKQDGSPSSLADQTIVPGTWKWINFHSWLLWQARHLEHAKKCTRYASCIVT